jgi:hypothetical protein
MSTAISTPTTTRRAILSGLAAASVVAVPAIAPALAGEPDTELVRLAADFDAAYADWESDPSKPRTGRQSGPPSSA